jgi:hypothetical protein
VERVLEALHRVLGPQDSVEFAHALAVGRSVRLALYVRSPDEIEAIGHALGICSRLLAVSPEFDRLTIADFKVL